MNVSAVLLLGLVAGSLAASTVKEDVNSSNNRGQRFLFNDISSTIASWIGLGEKSITVTKNRPTVPKVVYVKKVDKTQDCKTAFSSEGCQEGHVCTLANNCVPKSGVGVSCLSSEQCLSRVCRGYRCVQDRCKTVGGRSDCSQDETCVSTDSGYVCRAKDDTCSPPLTAGRCPEGQYCGSDGRCTAKLLVNAACEKAVQCADKICRHHRCKSDACPMLDSSLDCNPSEYCTTSSQGNVCKAKLEDGQQCHSPNQCQSYRCEYSKCIRHACPRQFSPERCPPQQFCLPGPNGNVCRAKLDKGAVCTFPQACKSGACTGGYCVEQQCSIPMTSDDCGMNEVCTQTSHGNTCMMKKADGAHCAASMQCLSYNCDGSFCRAQGDTTSTTPTTS